MIRFVFAPLILVAQAGAASLAPVNVAVTLDIPMFDGASLVTGLSPTVKIVRKSDGFYWTGSAWQSGSATVTATEYTQFSGRYFYTLSQSAIGTTEDLFVWSATATSGGIPLLTMDSVATRLPTTSSGVAKSNMTQIDGLDTSGNNATLNLKQLNIVNSTGTAIIANNSGGVGYGIQALGQTADLWADIAHMSIDNAAVVATVQGFSNGALASFVTQDTGETDAADGSVAALSGGAGGLTDEQSDQLAGIFGKLGSTTVTIQSPVATNGTLTIHQGMDYLNSSLSMTTKKWSGESMVGGTIAFYMMPEATYTSGSGTYSLGPVTCTFTNGLPGSDITVTIPLTAAQTAALTPSPAAHPLNYVYWAVGTTSGGHFQAVLKPAAATVVRMVH